MPELINNGTVLNGNNTETIRTRLRTQNIDWRSRVGYGVEQEFEIREDTN
jgi:hypothetical protein